MHVTGVVALERSQPYPQAAPMTALHLDVTIGTTSPPSHLVVTINKRRFRDRHIDNRGDDGHVAGLRTEKDTHAVGAAILVHASDWNLDNVDLLRHKYWQVATWRRQPVQVGIRGGHQRHVVQGVHACIVHSHDDLELRAHAHNLRVQPNLGTTHGGHGSMTSA
mmetsp:Transcript_109108/g.178114  ORF Transcript_109108/g.178114 Transcript_109108/m.178114 type:complete len:164 (-) Transcript_109108:1415-1906(-)